MTNRLTIIGIDPGLRHTGWGIVAQDGNRLSFIAAGRISPGASLPMATRLCLLAQELAAVL
ncbi:MAG: crossover junction endodeoxyribonuclease RuvC, partial [Pseudomonadota bacterium]|nr:crossover junction endodeoxyribonuclease RuvC [Pseudomonadota bacterium]